MDFIFILSASSSLFRCTNKKKTNKGKSYLIKLIWNWLLKLIVCMQCTHWHKHTILYYHGQRKRKHICKQTANEDAVFFYNSTFNNNWMKEQAIQKKKKWVENKPYIECLYECIAKIYWKMEYNAYWRE